MSIDLMPGFGAFTPASGGYPAPSAIEYVASPNWSTSGFTFTTGQADPDGGTEAVSMISPSTTTYGGTTGIWGTCPNHGLDYIDAATVTMSVYAKWVNGGGGTGQFLRMGAFNPGYGDVGCYFDIQNGTVGDYRSGGGTESNAGVISVGSGWYQVYFSFDTTGITAGNNIGNTGMGARSASSTDFDAGTSVTAGDGLLLWRFQIVRGTDPNG